jgi:hypothetical protein
MKKTILMGFALTIMISNTRAQSDNSSSAEKILLKMVSDHVDALQKGDTSWLKNNFSNQYTYTNPLGMVINKSDAIHVLASGAIKIDSTTEENKAARVYGDCGIVTELSTIKGHVGPMDISGVYRYLYVFAKSNGKWQIVAEQGTPVMKR